MGNGASRRLNDEEVPKKVAKWRAELEHVKELNKMLSEERKIVTTSMEQELYDKQVELFYLGKSATKHIGFRGYLKIINKVSPRTQADFMTPGNYDKNKKPAAQSTAMVLRSAILNFSLFALFEAWLLKRMHFVSIQKHQRRLHQKGWKNIVAFYSEEIPSIQEIFEKQEPGLRNMVEIGKKENMDMLEEYETKLFQQEEEIMRLRKMLEEMNDPYGINREAASVEEAKARPRMSLDQAFPGTTDAHREFNKARSPVQALIRTMEKNNSARDLGAPLSEKEEKGWRTDNARTWGASEDSDDESLYNDEDNNNNNNNNNNRNGINNSNGEKEDVLINSSDRLTASEKHGSVSSAEKAPVKKDPEISVDPLDDTMSAITMPNAADSASFDSGLIKGTGTTTSSVGNKDDQSAASGSATNSLSSAQKKQQGRDKEAIRLERERLEKAKADRKRRKEMERMERESFYKQERERLQHQEKRLTLKREESVRLRNERLHDVSVDGDDEDGGEDNNVDEFLDAVEEIQDDGQVPSKASTDDYEDDEEDLKLRPPKKKGSFGSLVNENSYSNSNNTDDDLVGEDEDEEVTGLNDMNLGDGAKKRNHTFSPEHHPSMNTDALLIDQSIKREKMDRRRMWQKDKADSDRELSADDDSIGNELKRLEEFETVIHSTDDEEIASSNISEDIKLLRTNSGRNLMEMAEATAPAPAPKSRPSSARSRPSNSWIKSKAAAATADDNSDEDYEDIDAAPKSRGSRSVDGSKRSNNGSVVALMDGSARSKSIERKPRRKLKDHLEGTGNNSDEGSVYSKGSKASKGSRGAKKKKKKKVRRKIKGADGASVFEDGEEEVVVRKKKKKKKKKVNEDDETFYEDEDMTVTSALTSGSYE